jgi:hypothetical protein
MTGVSSMNSQAADSQSLDIDRPSIEFSRPGRDDRHVLFTWRRVVSGV